MIIKQPSRLLAEMIEGLTQAAGGAGQLGHQYRDARFFVIRDALEITKGTCATMANLPILVPTIQ